MAHGVCLLHQLENRSVDHAPDCVNSTAASLSPEPEGPMSTTPSPEFKSSQYEFTDEQNRTITQLADSMGTVAMLIKVLGLAFLVFFAVTLYHAIQAKGNYAPAAGLGAATLLCLAIGFWTGA